MDIRFIRTRTPVTMACKITNFALYFADNADTYIPYAESKQQLTHEPLRAVGDYRDKYALIDGGKLWKYFIDISLNPPENNDYRHIISDNQLTEKLIFACLSVKKRFVEKDQFDKGERAVLNLGHTVGHAIEAMSDYKLSHGECVAKGIVQELRASVNMGFTDKSVLTDVISIFETLGISTDNPFLAEDEIGYIYPDIV